MRDPTWQLFLLTTSWSFEIIQFYHQIKDVFNDFKGTPNSESLKRQLRPGSKLHNHLPHNPLRWRCHPIVFTANIEKIYRQMMKKCSSCRLEPPMDFSNAKHGIIVTHELSCVSCLAIRTLHQLAEDKKHRYQQGTEIFKGTPMLTTSSLEPILLTLPNSSKVKSTTCARPAVSI
jgi:hypothetical protein